MTRKIISAFLSVALIAGFILPCLSGCKASSDATHYTVMEWLDNVELTFNLLYYSEEEPLVNSVKTSDESFDTVQIAAEWGIIDPADELDFGGRLSKELAADTLIRAMNCVKPSSAEMSDSKSVKPQYLENVMSSVNEGIFALDGNRFDPKKQLTKAEADSAMLAAYDKWVNFSYGESFDRSTLKENVINLGGVTSENSEPIKADYKVEYTGSRTFFDEGGGYTDNTTKTITFPANEVPMELKEGSVLAMPADDVVPMDYAVVVTGVDFAQDGSVTVSTRNAELEEVYEEIDVQQSGPIDFSEAVFYGPDGKRIRFDDEEKPESMLFSADNMKTEPLGLYVPENEETLKTKSKSKTSEKKDLGSGLSMKISCPLEKNGGGISIKIEGKVSSESDNLSVELGFDDMITIENRIRTHWDWFKLKVDDLRLSLKDTKTETFGFDCSSVTNFGETINHIGDNNGNGKWDIGDWASEAHKLRKIYGMTKSVGQSFKDLSKEAKSAANRKLVDFVIPSTNLHFVIRAELTVEGSLKLTLTQSNTAGIELMNGKLRPFSEKSNSQKLDFSAKIELTFRVAFEFQLIGINVADVGVKAGLGAKIDSVIYSYDKSSGTLLEMCGIEGAAVSPGGSINANDDVNIAQAGLPIATDDTRTEKICCELKIYPIVTVFGCSESSVAGKLFGAFELKVLGENTPLYTLHYESGEGGIGVTNECTVTETENYGVTTGDKLTLNVQEYSVGVSEDADTGLAVVTLPKNGNIKDVRISCDNTDVLEVKNLVNRSDVQIPSSAPSMFVALANGLAKIKNAVDPNNQSPGYKFGSWFYEDMSSGAKPQFALTGKKNGTANVTVSINGESITVPVKVGTGDEPIVSTGALITTKSAFTLAPREAVQTSFEFIPEGKTIADISFDSADTSVAKVSKGGIISAVGKGDTVITAVLRGEEKEYTLTFTVHVTE